jgi:hypothetical protein
VGLRQLIIDGYGWLNYKPVFADPCQPGVVNRRAFPEANRMWVPEPDQRRLAAYKLLAAYDNNQAAQLAEIHDGDAARDRREFGDPSMFIDTLMAHVLGREQQITVPGAEHDGEGTPPPDTAMAQRVQELLRDWSTAELLPMRMQQAERKAVTLGDGVYRLSWEGGKRRPVVRVNDPGFYYPVLDEEGDEFPDRVHFAWELAADPARGLKARLRRVTYELDWIRPATVPGLDHNSRPVRAMLPPPDAADGETPAPVLTRGDVMTPHGAISRTYAWNEEPSFVTCYLTDATWLLEDLKGSVDVDTLPLGSATFAQRSDGEVLDHLDLLIDFIPVVHVPNTVPSAEEHWGQSSLAKVLQVFDELACTDTDSSRASAITGSPILSISGKAATNRGDKTRQVAPGVVFELGEGGRMDALNTAAQLAELRNHTHDLQDRASATARLPAVAMGTLDPTKVPSGYALQLSLGPLDSLIGSMRLARDHKYRLLLKFAQRLFLAGQHPDWAGVQVQPAELAFGPYAPTDKQSVLDQVVAGVTAGVLSLETGLKMLQEAGYPIEDIAAEIENIQSRQFVAAVALANATGDSGAVGKFLGITLHPDPVAPPIVLPSLPGQPTNPDGSPADPNQPPTTAPGSPQGNAPTSANTPVQKNGGKGN